MSIRKIQKVRFDKKEIPYFFPEDGGFLESDQDNEQTYQITQKEICNSVDITSAAKHFDLKLSHLGPYKIDYFRNGRSLLLGGRNGHVAVFDWITKDLGCEFNVRESVHAVQWLHMPTMFAVAQADWTHVYDEKGIEIHCLKKFHHVYELDFLPYHFLLVGASDNGFLSWLDISTGQLVANYRMKIPRLTSLTHNPHNAITVTGHPNGSVRMWSPNVSESLVQLLCHPAAIRDVVIDNTGQFMITTSADRSVRVWDVRNYKCLNNFRLYSVPSKLSLSQRNLLGISSGNIVNIYKNYHYGTVDKPYLRHRLDSRTSLISSLKFCPFEDVLGIGHQDGFTSILVPGSGEPNFDALEANPYMTKSQRREMEVKALLEKINYELISLDPDKLAIVETKPKQSQNPYKMINKKRKIGKLPNANNSNPQATSSMTIVNDDNNEADDDDDDDESNTNEQQKKKSFDVEKFQPKKRGRKKLAQKLKSKAAKKEKIRRNQIKNVNKQKLKSNLN